MSARAHLWLVAALLGGCAGPSGTLGDDDDATGAFGDDDDDDDSTQADDDDDALPPPTLMINELGPHNAGSVLDDLGAASDWLELYNPGSQAVALDGLRVSDDWLVQDLHVLPPGLTVPAGGYLVLWADGQDPAPAGHLPFRLASDGEAVGIFTATGASLDWVEYPAIPEDGAWARLPNGGAQWSVVGRGSPGDANQDVVSSTEALIAPGAVWRALDSGVAPPTGWTELSYEDGGWTSGPAPLGYGDPVATQVGFGPDPDDKHITTWFRRRFTVGGDPTEATGLTLRLQVDDGALVWLNGVELGRARLPSGAIGPGTLASQVVSGAAETEWLTIEVTPDALVDGPNVLAVEVHQASPGSSDLGFDLGLDLARWIPAD